ncbi:MAG: cyanophycinase [Terriglobales bacterium]
MVAAGQGARIAVLFGLLGAACAQTAPAYQYLRAGRQDNVRVATRAGFALIGGGTDLDAAFQWMCQRSGNGDFLVLRASGTDAYNPYIEKLCPAEHSVATLILPSRAAALDPLAARAIAAASAVFIAGGDQSNYVNFWGGTPVQGALNDAIRRGVPLGGTSAGLAVLGEFAYSAQQDRAGGPNLTSAAALANPYQSQVVLVRGFLAIPALRGLVTDTHFHARNRLGRLLVFMARAAQDWHLAKMHAVGVDQHTALLVDGDGSGVAAGTGSVYLFAAGHAPATCRPGVPLDFAGIAVRRLVAGERFNLANWSGGGAAYALDVAGGEVRSNQRDRDPYGDPEPRHHQN